MNARGIRTPEQFASWSERDGAGLTFAGPDPHHGIGLDRLVPGYRVVSVDAPPALAVLAADGCATFAVDEAAGKPGTVARSVQALLADPSAASFIAQSPTPRLVVFKTNAVAEALCRERGWALLAAPASLGRRWENKLAFRAIAAELGLRQPPGAVVDLATTAHAAIAAQLGHRYVLQAPHGFSGSRTHLVSNATDFEEAATELGQREVRATSFLPGMPLTMNACVTARGVVASGPCLQITGQPSLTRYVLGSCGNDWSSAGRLDLPISDMLDMADVAGSALAAQGYRGIFGLDFVLAEDGQTYLIEVNPRLVASIALFTQLELAAGRLPLLARHILAFLAPELDEAAMDLHRAPIDGSQVILHNLSDSDVTVSATLACGAVTAESASEQGVDGQPTAHVTDLSAGQLLRLTPAGGRVITAGQELARMQATRALTDYSGDPVPDVQAVVRALGGQLLGALSQISAQRG